MSDEPEGIGSVDTSPLRGEVGAKRRVRGSVSRARSLRSSETEAEHRLWSIVRTRQLGGHTFVRQVSVGPYFADFACREAALILELDGSQHFESVPDVKRTAYLTEQSYSVLRFWNNDVLTNGHGVADAILSALSLHPSPGERFAPATLSPEGRGEKGIIAATAKARSPRLNGALAHLVTSPLRGEVGAKRRVRGSVSPTGSVRSNERSK